MIEDMEKRSEKYFRVIVGFFALFALPFIVYANSFNVPFIFDDIPNIVDNKAIQITELTFHHLLSVVRDSFYRSRWFANVTFAINYLSHGFSLPGYHLVNTLIHITHHRGCSVALTKLLFVFKQKANVSILRA